MEVPGRIYLTCMYEALFWACFTVPLTYFRDVLYTSVCSWVIGPVWASASSSIKVENNTSLSCWMLQLRIPETPSAPSWYKVHGNAEDGHYFNSFCCGCFAQRPIYHRYFFDKLVWSGVSERLPVCKRDYLYASWSMPEHIRKAKCIFQVVSDHKTSTQHIAAEHTLPLHFQPHRTLYYPLTGGHSTSCPVSMEQ